MTPIIKVATYWKNITMKALRFAPYALSLLARILIFKKVQIQPDET